jgi:hypothetical protein
LRKVTDPPLLWRFVGGVEEPVGMKAEERKELEKNALRAWVDRWKERLQGKTLYVLVGSVVLLVVAFFLYRYWSSSRAAANSARIMELIAADDEKKLDKIITSPEHQGKPTATWAKLQKARLALYADGLLKLGTPDPEARARAYARIEEGKKLYQEIVNDLNPSLQQEAYFSSARGEEALLGVPKADNPGEFRGNFDRMIDDYRKAAAINPDSDASKKYARWADEKQVKRAEIEKIYQELYRLGQTPRFGGDLP